MAKVTYVIYNDTYVSINNPSMKFQLEIRSYDGKDRKSSSQRDDQYINGAIDGIDVASDHLGASDLYQSQHIILREPSQRRISGYDYHMVESLANSCDIVGVPDLEETVTDVNGYSRTFKQLYSKAANSTSVQVKSYVDSMLADVRTVNLTYTPTKYTDEGPKARYISSIPSVITTVKTEIREAVVQGTIATKLVLPDNVRGSHTIASGQHFQYSLIYNSNKINNYTNDVTVTIQYGEGNLDSVFYQDTLRFDQTNYSTATDILEALKDTQIGALKIFLGTLNKYKLTLSVHNYGVVSGGADIQEVPSAPVVPEITTITDIWSTAWTVTGTPVYTENNAKFGTALAFSGDNPLIFNCSIPLGGKDFTIDFQLYHPREYKTVDIFSLDTNSKGYLLKMTEDGGYGWYRFQSALGTFDEQSRFKLPSDTAKISHLAIVYRHAAKLFSVFLNGTNFITLEDIQIQRTVCTNLSFGSTQNTFVGTIDEFRISDGIARWTANFSDVPTSEYSVDACTAVLLHC